MDAGEKRRKKILQPVIMDLPEQILRQIFLHLDHITLFVSLRNVCQRMKTYVNRYIGKGGLFILIGQSGSPIELYCIFQRSPVKFNIYKKFISPIVCNGDQEHRGSPCGLKCPPFHSNSYSYSYQLNYFSWNDELLACKNRYCKDSRLYQYQFMTDTWKVIFNKLSFCETKDPVQTCQHLPPIDLLEGTSFTPVVSIKKHQDLPLSYQGTDLKIPPYLVIDYDKNNDVIYEAKCHDGESVVKFPTAKDSLFNYSVCTKSNRMYLVGGFWKHPKSKWKLHPYAVGANSTKVDNTLKHLFSEAKITFNSTLLRTELVIDKMNFTSRSRYNDEIPYRSQPLCFELNNSLYIAGHVPCNSCIYKEDGTKIWRLDEPSLPLESILNEDKHFDRENCKCCDRLDLSNEKYHRYVAVMPYSLKRVIQPKIAIDKDDAFVIISFYDPIDFKEKIWTFTEDAGFVEHSDQASDVCNGCKKGADKKTFSQILFSTGRNPSDLHNSFCDLQHTPLPIKKQILRIK